MLFRWYDVLPDDGNLEWDTRAGGLNFMHIRGGYDRMARAFKNHLARSHERFVGPYGKDARHINA